MEEKKMISSDSERKPYEAPTAEVILLAPEERLSAWDYGYHTGDSGDSWRWALRQWSTYGTDPASGVTGTVSPANWAVSSEE